jgi:ABC-type nickel/cobalt efflux system permease component RcnA
MLSAISLGRVGYGLALILAFSVGLAATLTAVGLLFVYASRFVAGRRAGEGRLVKALPVLSSLVIACAGAAICYEALAQAGIDLPALISRAFAGGGAEGGHPSLASTGAFAVLGLGLVFGLKHATEVDHVVAVTTIVSEQRSLWRAAAVGGLWGAGHTASLVVVGLFVLTLRVAIPEGVAGWLEFGVALMIIALGVNAFTKALRGRADAHVHRHSHGGLEHAHVHFHDSGVAHAAAHAGHAHAVTRVGLKPVLVGAMHGLAGSAALTLLVLAQIDSAALGLLYLMVFGAGSVFGMMLMSGLVGLPFVLSSGRLSGVSNGLQTCAGVASVVFGLWYAYQTGVPSGLLGLTS